MLRGEEIGQAYQFGKETMVRNVLEPNWWESNEHQQEQQAIADEALRLDEERRRREEEGEDEEEKPNTKQVKANGHTEKPRVIARTRVSAGRRSRAHSYSCNLQATR